MSKIVAPDHRKLEGIVRPVDTKITAGKDASKPYVGLEQLPSRGAYLLGWEPASHSVSTNSIFSAGDVLFGKLRPNLRKCVSAPFDGYCSTDILVLRARDDVHAGFAARVFQSEGVGAAAERTAIGTKMPRTSWANLSTLEVFCPDFSEQESVAQVLDTLDKAIQQTEAIVAKLKAVKQGLLHDLMTRGIGVNGELRPPPLAAPHLYAESVGGWVPKGWNVCVLEEAIAHTIDFRGRTPKKLGMTWGGGDILALSANNVQPGRIDILRESYVGSIELYQKWMTNGPTLQGDVLLTMEAPLGNIAQIPDGKRYIVSQRVIALRFQPSIMNNDFMFWQMQSYDFQKEMIRRSTGSTAVGIRRAELVKMQVKYPPLPEQSAIAVRLNLIETNLRSEVEALEKYRQQKAGLMDDLLTGRVRVSSLPTKTEQSALEAAA